MRLDRSGVRLSTLDLYEQTPVLLSGHDGGAWHARTSGTDPEGTLTDVLDTVLTRR